MRLEGNELVEVLANPLSVAVVGASADVRRLSGRPVDYLTRLGYAGRLYAVNPRSDLPGVDTVRSLRELPHGSVDVALVAVPARAVVGALEDAESIGARAAIVIGSGFEDRDGEPRGQLDAFARGSSLRIVGPNCVGTLGVAASSYLTFSSVLLQDVPRSGRVGLVTQSGALGNSLLQSLIRRHVGLNQWFSTGNEVDVGAIELATGLLERDGVDAVGMFLEGVSDPAWLGSLQIVLRETRKPLFVLKAAHSASGRQAAAGHTGRIVGSSDASDAILAEIGVRAVGTVAVLADALVVAGVYPGLLRTARPAVSLVSVSGAAGVIGADRVAHDDRLVLATLDPAELHVDGRLHVSNPLDVPFINETGVFTDVVGAVGGTSTVDLIVAVESSLAHDREELVAKMVAGATAVPVVLTSLSEDDQIPAELTRQLCEAGIAYLPTVERAVAAVAVCSATDRPAVGEATAQRDQSVRAPAALRGLEWVAEHLPPDVPWAEWQVLLDGDHATPAATRLGIPLVVKAAGRTIEHRTEHGAVRFVRTEEGLSPAVAAVSRVCSEHGDAVMLQAAAAPGFEVLVSVVRDPEFGPVAFVRPGGTFAELMDGQAVVWSGWDAARRLHVLHQSRIGELLSSYRGGTAYDVEGLADLLTTCLAAVEHAMSFLEMNPVIVHEDGVTLVDAVART
jgi:acyl-CoA synthetase (NDP forming)